LDQAQRKQKNLLISQEVFLSSGNWIHFSTLFRNGPKGEQPKETPIALQSDFLFCSQDDASIT
jgi:hypothetical protein